MTTDVGKTGAAATTDPVKPTIADLLKAEEVDANAAVPLTELKSYLQERDSEIITRVENDFRTRQQREREQAEAQTRQNASIQEDIDFAQNIYDNLQSSDQAKRAEAESQMAANDQRYARGRAALYNRQSEQSRLAAVGEYLTPVWEGVRQAGHAKLIDEVFTDRTAEGLLAKHNGNWMLVAAEYFENIGYERGKNEAANEADQERRVTEGTKLPPGMTGGASSGKTGSLEERAWEGIDRSQPGASAKYQAKLAQLRAEKQ